MLNKRTHILFDQRIFDLLSWLSRSQNISIGELVRKAVKKTYSENIIKSKREEVIKRIFARKPMKISPFTTSQLVKWGRRFEQDENYGD